MPKKAIIILPLGLVAISLSSILIKLCEAPVLTIAAYRLTVASAFFIGIKKIRRQPILALFDKRQLKWSFFSGVFLTVHFATWIASLQFTSVASSVVLVQTAPIFVAISAYLFLRERISKLLAVGIFIAVAGGIFIGTVDVNVNQMSLRGDILAVAGAIGASGYMLIGRSVRSSIDTFSYVIVVYSVAAVLLLALSAFAGNNLIGYSLKIYVLLFSIAFIPQVIGHTTINWTLKYLSASTVSVIILAEPIGATILAYFILGESVSVLKIVGAAIILTGVVITLNAESQHSKTT